MTENITTQRLVDRLRLVQERGMVPLVVMIPVDPEMLRSIGPELDGYLAYEATKEMHAAVQAWRDQDEAGD